MIEHIPLAESWSNYGAGETLVRFVVFAAIGCGVIYGLWVLAGRPKTKDDDWDSPPP